MTNKLATCKNAYSLGGAKPSGTNDNRIIKAGELTKYGCKSVSLADNRLVPVSMLVKESTDKYMPVFTNIGLAPNNSTFDKTWAPTFFRVWSNRSILNTLPSTTTQQNYLSHGVVVHNKSSYTINTLISNPAIIIITTLNGSSITESTNSSIQIPTNTDPSKLDTITYVAKASVLYISLHFLNQPQASTIVYFNATASVLKVA